LQINVNTLDGKIDPKQLFGDNGDVAGV